MTTIPAYARPDVEHEGEGSDDRGEDSKRPSPATASDDEVGPDGDLSTHRWMTASAIAVVAAILIGGITRLTESGLTITEWKPVSGVLPPLSGAQWQEAFARYLRIPEAQTVHQGISLAEFQRLFWWEWFHRLLARGVGLVLAIPYFVLLLRRRIRPGLRLLLANLPILAAMQGAMGWHMVKSGLSERTDVSQYRLVAHLALALVLLGIIVWTRARLRRHLRPAGHAGNVPRALRIGAVAFAALVSVTLLSGGFVAGLDAGRIFNSFPLMGGTLVPAGYSSSLPFWTNAFENPVAAQFNHRLLATATLLGALTLWYALRGAALAPRARRALHLVAAIAITQLALGVATLLLVVPLPVALLHQLGGVALFIVAFDLAQQGSAVMRGDGRSG